MDAHLLEKSVVQENQRLAFDKYLKTLPVYELGKKELQANSLELQNRISALEQAIEKVDKIIDKIKPGKVTQTGKRAKTQRAKKRKKT